MDLQNKNFIIFGVSGWVGTALCDYLVSELKIKTEQIFPISSSLKTLELLATNLTCYNSKEILAKDPKNSIFFHLAFKGKELASELGNAAFLKANQEIRETATQLIKELKPETIIYSSSGAALDPNQETNPYGYQKAQDEKYFQNLATELNSRILIPRIFNIAGKYINKFEIYALSDLLLQAVNKQKMEIKAPCKVVRSYLEIFDLFKIIFAWLNEPTANYTLFETANYLDSELGDLANLVNEFLGTNYPIERELNPNLAANIYVGDIKTQETLTKKYGITIKSPLECVASTYDYLKAIGKIT